MIGHPPGDRHRDNAQVPRFTETNRYDGNRGELVQQASSIEVTGSRQRGLKREDPALCTDKFGEGNGRVAVVRAHVEPGLARLDVLTKPGEERLLRPS